MRERAYATVDEWVTEYFAPLFGDDLAYVPGDRLSWCPQWWRHPSAAVRLHALWQAWEHYRLLGGPALSVWFLDHADPHVRQLTAPNGPFRRCSVEGGHKVNLRLPIAERPEVMAAEPPIKWD
ncbi:DUF4913 domain-containing protein [Nocardia sp. NPDC050413]|uniref:DUF4913 domain-containing protein n=1 Tax=Nocardia sp. NPDC050413 TaxID=3155784 RepID=UPI0033EC8BA7